MPILSNNCFTTHVICWVHTMRCMPVCCIWINALTLCSAGTSQSNRWEMLFSCTECTWQTGMWDTSTVAGDWLSNYIDILKGAWQMRGPDGLHLPSQNKLGFLSAVTFTVCIYLCLCVSMKTSNKTRPWCIGALNARITGMCASLKCEKLIWVISVGRILRHNRHTPGAKNVPKSMQLYYAAS